MRRILLMRNPRHAITFQHADTLSRMELLVGLLNNGQHGAVIQFDSDLQSILAGHAFLDRRAGQAASNRANNCAYGAALTVADAAAGDSADYRASGSAYRALGAFNLDRTHTFHYAHLHG